MPKNTPLTAALSKKYHNMDRNLFFFFELGFTPCKDEQPQQGMELQEKETHKD